MKMKNDKTKLAEKRCLGEGPDYIGYLKANEAKSTGSACMIYDPIAGRTVDTLSKGEQDFFFIMRYRDDVAVIQEQMRMSQDVVKRICEEHGFRTPRRILSTDFLITFQNGNREAYSIKLKREEFNPNALKYKDRPELYERLLIRQYIEKEYWNRYGIPFRIVFSEELNKILAANIRQCLAMYNENFVSNEESMLRYLVAHKVVRIPMDTEKLRFPLLAKGHEAEIRRLYAESRRE